jgi:hypothetical protein
LRRLQGVANTASRLACQKGRAPADRILGAVTMGRVGRALAAFVGACVISGAGIAQGAQQYRYDQRGRLIRIEYEDCSVVRFFYDLHGNRVQRWVVEGDGSCAGNQAPVAGDDVITLGAGSSQLVDLLGPNGSGGSADSDPNGDELRIASVDNSSALDVVLQSDRQHALVSAPGAAGLYQFTYNLEDPFGLSSTGLVSVDVVNAGTPPIVLDPILSSPPDFESAFYAYDLAEDPDGDDAQLIFESGLVSVSGDTGSSVEIDPVDPARLNFASGSSLGLATLSLAVRDETGLVSAIGNIRVLVEEPTPLPEEGMPQPQPDTYYLAAGAAHTLSPLDNDTDPDNDTLEIVAVTSPSNGGSATIINGGQNISYTPLSPGTENFDYTVTDGVDGDATTTITITVQANDPVVANDDSVLVASSGTVTELDSLLSNDTASSALEIVSVQNITNGSVSISTDKQSVTYDPQGVSGNQSFDYTVEDSQGQQDDAHVSVLVNSPPNFPTMWHTVVYVAEYDTQEHAIVIVDGMVDPDGHDPKILAVWPGGGGLELDPAGETLPSGGYVRYSEDTLYYTPPAGATVTVQEEFSFRGRDDFGAAGTGYDVELTFTVGNTAPIAIADSVTRHTGSTTTLDVLANDTDADGDTLTITDVGTPSGGGSVFIANSATRLEYTAGPVGTETFSYTVSDGRGASDTTTVTVTVEPPPNSAPVAVADSVSHEMGETATLDVLANDTDVDGDSLTIVAVGTPSAGGSAVIVDNDTRIEYAAGAIGAETFSYTISDGRGETNTATVTANVVNLQNSAPTVGDDTYLEDRYGNALVEGFMVLLLPLNNDSDPDGDTLTITSFGAPSNGGVANVVSDQFLQYTPGATGTETFSYSISDGNGGTASGTIVATVYEDTAPVANDDTWTGYSGVATQLSPLDNDTHIDWDNLWITGVGTPSLGGSVSIASDGRTLAYTPGSVGSETFSYTVRDAQGDADTATITVAVGIEGNTAPTAVADAIVQVTGTSNTLDVLSNDGDVDSDPLTITAVDVPSAGGSVNIISGGAAIEYTAGAIGTETFSYTIDDGRGGSATASVSVTVEDTPNVAPVAVDDNAAQVAGVTAPLDVLANDTDVDNDPLTITAVGTPSAGGSAAIINGGAGLEYTAGAAGTEAFTYTVSDGRGGTATGTVTATVHPNVPPVAQDDAWTHITGVATVLSPLDNDTDAEWDNLRIASVGTPSMGGSASIAIDERTLDYVPGSVGIETFTYTVVDQQGNSATATIVVTVDGVPNADPIATSDGFTQETGETLVLDVLANDDDPEGDALTITSVTSPSYGGAASVSAGGDFIEYTAGFVGTETFTYTIADGNGGTATGTVTATVELGVVGGNLIQGTAAGDQLSEMAGSAANDTFLTYAGNDYMRGFGGSDYYDGGDGRDVIVLEGAITDYAMTVNPDGGYILYHSTGVSVIKNIEGLFTIGSGQFNSPTSAYSIIGR